MPHSKWASSSRKTLVWDLHFCRCLEGTAWRWEKFPGGDKSRADGTWGRARELAGYAGTEQLRVPREVWCLLGKVTCPTMRKDPHHQGSRTG